jgi:hypothetical protein
LSSEASSATAVGDLFDAVRSWNQLDDSFVRSREEGQLAQQREGGRQRAWPVRIVLLRDQCRAPRMSLAM